MAFPTRPDVHRIKVNGLYAAFCVIVVFPFIVLADSHSDAGPGMTKLCKASGRLFYPPYITHFPFLYVWMNYVADGAPSLTQLAVIGLSLIPACSPSPTPPKPSGTNRSAPTFAPR